VITSEKKPLELRCEGDELLYINYKPSTKLKIG